MQISDLISRLEGLFPGFKPTWEPLYRMVLRDGPDLEMAYDKTMATWTSASFPKPEHFAANLPGKSRATPGKKQKPLWPLAYEKAAEMRWEFQRKLEEHWRQRYGTQDPDVPYTMGGRTVMVFALSNEWIHDLSNVMRDRLERYLIEKAFDDLGAGDMTRLKRAHDALAPMAEDIEIAKGRDESQKRLRAIGPPRNRAA